MTDSSQPRFRLSDGIHLLRPSQWTKNAVVLAAFFFALGDRTQAVPWHLLLPALTAAALFCLVSSGVYILNDILDVEADRLHPLKRHRPVAAGRIRIPAAWTVSVILITVALAASWRMSPGFGRIVAAYLVIQFLYNLWLKGIALLDIFVIAGGFVLRAMAGGVVLGIHISPWLLVCTLLLALFLALCKRRHEKQLLEETAGDHRAALHRYDVRLLDQLIAVVSAATVVCYSIYTLSPETVLKFGSARMGFTIPFVIFGIFRYLDLVYRKDEGGHPERVLLTDVPLLVNLALYGASVLCIFILR